jgi:hypothetical protein
MKKLLFSLAFLAFAAMTIVSCGSKSDPKSVATSFLQARNKMDYENAKKFGTPETGKMLKLYYENKDKFLQEMKKKEKKK